MNLIVFQVTFTLHNFMFGSRGDDIILGTALHDVTSEQRFRLDKITFDNECLNAIVQCTVQVHTYWEILIFSFLSISIRYLLIFVVIKDRMFYLWEALLFSTNETRMWQ